MNDFERWLSPIALVVSAVVGVMTILSYNRSQKREITFSGTPLDKKEFERHVADNKIEHEKIFAKLGGVERGVEARINAKLDLMQADAKSDRENLHARINPIEGEICGLREASETNTARLVQMDGKIDRLIERVK